MKKPSLEDLRTYLFLEDSRDLPDSSDACEHWVAKSLIGTGLAQIYDMGDDIEFMLNSYMVPDYLIGAPEEEKETLLQWLYDN